jgi:hypothetical protein
VIGLKIANNAFGGISVSGSMIRAIDYGLRFARQRNLPLVFNMSFGVGNEAEGAARIDAIVDSVLAANPDVVFVTSAGNDGPGLSTMGFPASAARVVTVGATYPPSFLERPVPNGVVAFFSSRGAELSKPDLIAPGIAYSTVPRWDTGAEDKSGTSMASPHVAGAVAALLSGVKQEKRTVTAAQVKQALVGSARPLPGALAPDQGAGLLDLVAADRVIRKLPAMAVMHARVGSAAAGGGYRFLAGNTPDTTVTMVVQGALGGPVRLASDVAWLTVPPSVQLTPPETRVPIGIQGARLADPGVFAGVVTGWASDTTIGPLFRLQTTVVRPHQIPDSGLVATAPLGTAGTFRVFFPADSARPFRVTLAASNQREQLLAFLYEPGGQPYRVQNGAPGGFGDAAAVYDVDGRDVVAGWYEAVAVAPPAAAATARVRVDRAPVLIQATRTAKDTVTATVTGAVQGETGGSLMFGVIGAERTQAFSQRGGAERRVTFRAPGWVRRVVVELDVPRAVWPIFTDLGLALQDANGEFLETEPLNYHLGRLSAELPAATADRELVVVLLPGIADPTANPLWEGDLSIRLYAESPVLVDPVAPAEFSVARGRSAAARFKLGESPWPLPDGFFPLGNVVVDTHGVLWGRETRLYQPKPPLMR